MKAPKTFKELFEAFGSTANMRNAVEHASGGTYSRQRVDRWKREGHVPAAQFSVLVDAATFQNIPGITFEALHNMRAEAPAMRIDTEQSNRTVQVWETSANREYQNDET